MNERARCVQRLQELLSAEITDLHGARVVRGALADPLAARRLDDMATVLLMALTHFEHTPEADWDVTVRPAVRALHATWANAAAAFLRRQEAARSPLRPAHAAARTT